MNKEQFERIEQEVLRREQRKVNAGPIEKQWLNILAAIAWSDTAIPLVLPGFMCGLISLAVFFLGKHLFALGETQWFLYVAMAIGIACGLPYALRNLSLAEFVREYRDYKESKKKEPDN